MPDNHVSVISAPLQKRIANDPKALLRIVIELGRRPASLTYAAAARQIKALIRDLLENAERTEQHVLSDGDETHPYLKARLQGSVIVDLLNRDQTDTRGPLISAITLDADDIRYFNPDTLIRTVISLPLLARIEADENATQDIQIEVNCFCEDGLPGAKTRLRDLIKAAIANSAEKTVGDDASPLGTLQGVSEWKTEMSEQYVYATLAGWSIQELVQLDHQQHQKRVSEIIQKGTANPASNKTPINEKQLEKFRDFHTIYHIWPDFKLRAQIWRSVATVKADACRRSFATTGKGMVWAIFDSGIDGNHPHFQKHSNLKLPSGLKHMDFMQPTPVSIEPELLTDDYGHGTHVAGIIAGELDDTRYRAVSLSRERNQSGAISFKQEVVTVPVIGVALECTLLSYKVLDKNGEGNVSTVIAAIQKVQQLNGYGRNLVIHGANMSLGYDFDPEWFACGQSPICVEVDRLVRSGVAVVIAAGNTGRGFALTINDPGNAELAVTVGATHRDMPHRYGVSYFSSKGPTADGRAKPDLLAPGERIISCAAGPDLTTYLNMSSTTALAPEPGRSDAYYLERSGTSMAAPHVAGILAGILSIRTEFIGHPEQLKDYLVQNAIDLGREKNFQGGGLVDMMRTIQAI